VYGINKGSLGDESFASMKGIAEKANTAYTEGDEKEKA
jgi:hypothetical protein